MVAMIEYVEIIGDGQVLLSVVRHGVVTLL